MMTKSLLKDADQIVVGMPMPFSVYAADRKLLLAKGSVVESERMLHSLIRSGRFQSHCSSLELAEEETQGAQTTAAESVLDKYLRDLITVVGQSRIGVRLSRDEASESYLCWMLGADEVHGLMVTAPTKPDRTLIGIAEGQSWVFRMMYMTAAVKFTGVIRKSLFDPVPMINVSLPSQVEMRQVRASPRVASGVRGYIELGKNIPAVISDVSTGGVRIAVERSQCELKVGQRTHVAFTLQLLGSDYNFKVPATIVSIKHEFEKQYPDLHLAGLKIEAQSEQEKLVLHGYVFERMALDFNAFWRVLTINR